jgi:hypothetical protein
MRKKEFVNTHRAGGPSRVWLLLVTPTEIEELATARTVGKMDESIHIWLEGAGFEQALDVPYRRETEWALENHLAPGQAFCIEVGVPRYWQDYFGEWDEEIDVEIVAREPISDRMAAYRWARYLELRLKKGIWR